MIGKELIEYIVKNNILEKDLYVNYTYKHDAGYLNEIKNINLDADGEVYIDIGNIIINE